MQIIMDGDNSVILACASVLSAFYAAIKLYFAKRSEGTATTAIAEELLESHVQRYVHGFFRAD